MIVREAVDAVVLFVLLGVFAALYWVVALVAPRKRDGIPGINLPEASATPETWYVAHSAIAPAMKLLAVYATLVAILIPAVMLAGIEVPGWVAVAAIAVGLAWFSAQIPRALKAARHVSTELTRNC